MMNKGYSKLLLKWYQDYGERTLPWRRTNNPYKIWISEIMLQQTQIKMATPYYLKWIKQYPTLIRLSEAKLDDLLILWQGLGYYRRVENISKTAKIIKKHYNAQLPDNYDELIQLPGIGDYTASAILAIAYNKMHIAIDGNIKRIISRVYILPKKQQSLIQYKKYTKKYISMKNPGDSIQLLMDIGRTICKPVNPLCTKCPLSFRCKSYHQNKTHLFPNKKKKIIPTFNVAVGLIQKNNKFIISKRVSNGLLGNLWELPGGKIKNNESHEACLLREIKEELNIKVIINNQVGTINHQHSHFKVVLNLFICNYHSGIPKPLKAQKIKWIGYKDISNFAFPRGTHKLFHLLKKEVI